MATNKRTYPNDYFAWYNDDNRVAILTEQLSTEAGDRTSEKYDSFQGGGSSGGISAFTDSGSNTIATSSNHGLLTGDTITIADSENFDGSVEITRIDDDSFSFVDGDTPDADEIGTWSSDNVINGLRITYHSKYEEVTSITKNLYTNVGLDSALHSSVVCYVKARLFEDMGDFQKSQYFRTMFERMVKKHRSRRSGIRSLSVPRI